MILVRNNKTKKLHLIANYRLTYKSILKKNVFLEQIRPPKELKIGHVTENDLESLINYQKRRIEVLEEQLEWRNKVLNYIENLKKKWKKAKR